MLHSDKNNNITLNPNPIILSRIISFILLAGFLSACSHSDKKEIDRDVAFDSVEYTKSTFDSIATQSQSTLLQNVASAIEIGGTEYAVEFCNERALPITDSLSNHFDVSISRITDKTRNPDNGLKTALDRLVFEDFINNSDLIDSLINEEGRFTYYKRINTALPACIKCHGSSSTDIDELTHLKIQTFYPDDLAVGYGMNELRGLWKLETKN